jgi:hypothetical protein
LIQAIPFGDDHAMGRLGPVSFVPILLQKSAITGLGGIAGTPQFDAVVGPLAWKR